MKHEKISIKWKIFLYLLVFTGLLLFLLWLVQVCYLDRIYKFIKTKEAERTMNSAVRILEHTENKETIQEEIDALAAGSGMAIMITTKEGTVCYNAEYIVNSKLNTIPKEILWRCYEQAAADGGSTRIKFEGGMNKTFGAKGEPPKDGVRPPEPKEWEPFVQNHGQDFMESVIDVSIREAGGQEYLLLVNTQLTPVNATVQTLRAELVTITAVMVFLSLIIAFILSKQISGSFIKMNQSAGRMAKGEFDVVFEGNDYREIAELSDALNKTAAELGKSERFRRELIANVSHDLRTPLTMIIAYAEAMRDLPGENSPENIQVVIDEAERLKNLVNDLLDISKIQAGVLKLNLSRYNLTESMEVVLKRYSRLKDQERCRIYFESKGSAYVEADEEKINQVIYNLVNNAVNYAGEDSAVTVRQIIRGDLVRIEVEDNGEGIEPEALPYVWERYHKGDKTHRRAVTGTGLGLSIVKYILELHHAEYGVQSTVGKGTTFWFELERRIDV